MTTLSKYLLITIIASLALGAYSSPASTGGVTNDKIGKIYFFYPSGNKRITARNKSIARSLSRYYKRHAPVGFPIVLLGLYDQREENSLSAFEQVLVGYERQENEFFEGPKMLSQQQPAVFIDVSLSQGHAQAAIKALDYAIKNIDALKQRELVLAKKKSAEQLSDDDMHLFMLD